MTLSGLLPACLLPALSISLPSLPADRTSGEVPGLSVEHHYAENDGVKIHYVTAGEGPLVVMVHGFPDYWYTWRDQMRALSSTYRVAALDLRGYNRSDKPMGVAAYAMPLLIGDVLAVIDDLGEEKAIVVGHDWGAAISWYLAMLNADVVDRLVILSVPHPSGFAREMSSNAEQQKNTQYARDFQEEGAHESLTAEKLASWVTDDDARERYVEAFQRSDFEAMLHYYKANYPKSSPAAGTASSPAPAPKWPRIQAPTLVIHGLQDKALNARGHAHCWEWIEADTTLVMLPEAGHFIQQDESERLTREIVGWLQR